MNFISIAVSALGQSSWPELYTYSFTPLASSAATDKVLGGRGSSVCEGTINGRESLSNVGIATMRQASANGDGSCYTSARYANSDYRVEKGTIRGGPVSAVIEYEAYRVHPAATAATEWVACGTELFFKFANEGEHHLYTLAGTGVKPVGKTVTVTSVADFVGGGIDIRSITNAQVYFAVPSSVRVSSWPKNGAVERATLFKGAQLTMLAERFEITGSGVPFDPAKDWNQGIDSHAHKYGTPKRFFRVVNNEGGEGVVWQDATIDYENGGLLNAKIYVTWFDGSGTTELTNTGNSYLGAAASDGGGEGKGMIIYIVVGKGEVHFYLFTAEMSFSLRILLTI